MKKSIPWDATKSLCLFLTWLMPAPATTMRLTTSPLWMFITGFSPFLGALFHNLILKVVRNKLWAQSMLLLLPLWTSCSSFLVEKLYKLKSQWRNLSVWLLWKWAKIELMQWQKNPAFYGAFHCSHNLAWLVLLCVIHYFPYCALHPKEKTKFLMG